MKLKLTLIIFSLLLPNLSFAQSLDEIYRDIVKSDNEGYLPLFVKNRQAPDFLDEDSLKISQPENTNQDNATPINLLNNRQIADMQKEEDARKWKNTVEAIKLNQITPVELNIVESKVAQNDPKATEVYAWMLARGVGINQDLIKSFNMYQRAAFLEVPDAEKNAITVYRAMTPTQRSQVKPMGKLEDIKA